MNPSIECHHTIHSVLLLTILFTAAKLLSTVVSNESRPRQRTFNIYTSQRSRILVHNKRQDKMNYVWANTKKSKRSPAHGFTEWKGRITTLSSKPPRMITCSWLLSKNHPPNSKLQKKKKKRNSTCTRASPSISLALSKLPPRHSAMPSL